LDQETVGKMSVELRSITAMYGDVVAVKNVDLKVREKEFVTLLGPSGCGKTTTLNVAAGLLRPKQGRVYLDGEDITDLPPYQRGMSMIFQSYALFPHMNVFDNVRFGLKIRGMSRQESEGRVRQALELVRLGGYEKRMPTELSGGEQQRVALARAIVIEPKVLLLDEPLSNLDAKLRIHMRSELKKIQKRIGVTAVYVTHDQAEALTMSDEVVVMNKGAILQVGRATEIYQRPRSKFVADFIGEINFFEGTIEEVVRDSFRISSNLGFTLSLPNDRLVGEVSTGRKALICIRPEHLRLTEESKSAGVCVVGNVEDVQFTGASIRYLVELPSGEAVQVRETYSNQSLPSIGQRVSIQIDSSLVSVLEYEL